MPNFTIEIHIPELAILAEALRGAEHVHNVTVTAPAPQPAPQQVPQPITPVQQAPINPTMPAQPVPTAPRTAPCVMPAPYTGAPVYRAPAGSAPGAATPYPSNPAQPPRAPQPYPQYPAYPAPVAPVAAQQPQPPAATPAPQPAPQQVPIAAAPTYKIDDLSRAAALLMDTGKDIQALLAQFGVQQLQQLQPAQFGAFATALRGMGARL